MYIFLRSEFEVAAFDFALSYDLKAIITTIKLPPEHNSPYIRHMLAWLRPCFLQLMVPRP